MNIAQFSIEKNRITFLVLGAIIALGLAMYQTMARDSMPPFTIRVATVVSSFPGASPERVEQLVTDKIEKVAQELPELKEVNSTSRTGLSVVSVMLKDDVKPAELQSVWDRLRRKLNALKGLPNGVNPNLNDDGIGDVYGIALGMTSDGYSYAEMKEYADDVRDALIKLDDAAKVELGGVQDERVFIEFDNARLANYNLTANRLQSIIASTNILSSGGEVNLEDERIILEPTGNFNSIEDIRQTLVPVGSGNQLVYLGDITSIRQDYVEPPSQVVSVNGKEAISFHIALKDGSNIVGLGVAVDELVEEWKSRLPVGLELSRIASMDTYIDTKIGDFVTNLLQAIAIVLAVMIIFMGFRTGLVISSLIPIVTVMTLMLMALMGVGLNQVTLAALIMALGMMVDNAIVVAESILVRMEQGVPAKEAAIDSASELTTPLLISTLTTSAAFMAFYLAESTMGDIVGPIFVVISLALISSWIVALSVVTMFCVLFLKAKAKEQTKPRLIDRVIDRLKLYYKDLILWSLARKRLVIGGTIVLFFASLFGFSFIPFVFFPDSDRNLITVDINLPLGTRIERTIEVASEIERFMADSLLVGGERSEGVLDWSS
ncbi:MAG: efflux RND transporter permease subunit, partial [Rhodothermales bacterium]|nr:efflux RND transporter permease subunit [Rhodothermales bacterium]